MTSLQRNRESARVTCPVPQEKIMKYLVTGGSGYVGKTLVKMLLAQKDTESVHVLDIRIVCVPVCARALFLSSF